MKNNKGITLVALVVTIIVLLILAAVSINLVLGDNGIVTRAMQAKQEMESDEMEENKQLDDLSDELEYNVGREIEVSYSDLINTLYMKTFKMSSFTKDGKADVGFEGQIIVEEDGKYYEVLVNDTFKIDDVYGYDENLIKYSGRIIGEVDGIPEIYMVVRENVGPDVDEGFIIEESLILNEKTTHTRIVTYNGEFYIIGGYFEEKMVNGGQSLVEFIEVKEGYLYNIDSKYNQGVIEYSEKVNGDYEWAVYRISDLKVKVDWKTKEIIDVSNLNLD